MRRVFAILGSALFFVVAPGAVAGWVPWRLSRWRVEPSLLALPPLRAIGILLIIGGGSTLLNAFARFALGGQGTPAPVFPTRYLVIGGPYRYVRNPMYLAVVSLVIGQGFLFGNLRLIGYGAFVWLCFHLFVVVYEEPTLVAAFGSQYEEFSAHVPRWVPRSRPWSGPGGYRDRHCRNKYDRK